MEIQDKFNLQIGRFFREIVQIFIKNPRLLLRARFLSRQQRVALKIRTEQKKLGVDVPPMIIFSVTKDCNLNCKGCYHRAIKREEGNLNTIEIERILGEARDLGVSIALIAGGEPMMRRDLFDLITRFSEILFVVFTNGTLIDKKCAVEIKRFKNMVTVISIEGGSEKTDKRRGVGVSKKIGNVMPLIKGAPMGVSFTVTRENIEEITSVSMIKQMVDAGVNLFFFVEYVPFLVGTEERVLGSTERLLLKKRLLELRGQFRAIFISFPGDEEEFGGCLAAGRGFVHISPSGKLEPCPFSPYSDVSLKTTSLQVALQSDFLAKIRAMEGNLKENGGCALFSNKEEVENLLKCDRR